MTINRYPDRYVTKLDILSTGLTCYTCVNVSDNKASVQRLRIHIFFASLVAPKDDAELSLLPGDKFSLKKFNVAVLATLPRHCNFTAAEIRAF